MRERMKSKPTDSNESSQNLPILEYERMNPTQIKNKR